MNPARKCPPNQTTPVFRLHLDLNSDRFRDAVGRIENNLVVVDGQHNADPDQAPFGSVRFEEGSANWKRSSNMAPPASANICRMPGRAASTTAKFGREKAGPPAVWRLLSEQMPARRGRKAGRAIPEAGLSAPDFSLEFVAQMAIADYRRDSS